MANIEQARKDREARKNAIIQNLGAEKEARLQEIDRMQKEQLEKMAGLSDKERHAAEAQFSAEKARLESEFNEKMLKSQREAAPSEAANSPARHGSQESLASPSNVVRLVPQKLVSEVALSSDAPSLNEARPVTVQNSKLASPIKSVKSARSGSSQGTSPVPGAPVNMSMLQTADEASALDTSLVVDVEYEKRDFNEIDILGTLHRDDKGNIIVPVDEFTALIKKAVSAGKLNPQLAGVEPSKAQGGGW